MLFGKVRIKRGGKSYDLLVNKHVLQNRRLELFTKDEESGFPVPEVIFSCFVRGWEAQDDDEFLVKDWSENADWFEFMVQEGHFIPTGEVVDTGHVVAKVCRLSDQIICDLDSRLC